MDKELGVPRLERGPNRERPTPLTLASTLSRGRVNAESTEGEVDPEAGGLFLEAQTPALCHKAEGTTMSTKADNHDHEKTKRAEFGNRPAKQSSWEGRGKGEGVGLDPQKAVPRPTKRCETIGRFFVQPALIYPHHTGWVSNTDWPAPAPSG